MSHANKSGWLSGNSSTTGVHRCQDPDLALPSEPRSDLLALLRAAGIEAVYPDGDRWTRTR